MSVIPSSGSACMKQFSTASERSIAWVPVERASASIAGSGGWGAAATGSMMPERYAGRLGVG